MEYKTLTLPNGIRLLHIPDNSKLAYCGIIINTGSRDEKPEETGMAHFIEHVIFKGTKKRKAYHIISRLEDVGGELNAYTTKEETCVYTTFLTEYYERAVELLSDIVFNSTFPEKELQKEKEVIIDEINSYFDSPAEQILDDFDSLVHGDQQLGQPILGTPEMLETFTKEKVIAFINEKYNTDQIVISSVGNIKFEKLQKWVEKYFSHIPENLRNFKRQHLDLYKPVKKIVKKDSYQAHCVVGNLAYSYSDKRRTTLILLNNILGGLGMNSRLNMALREKNGFAYNVESNYSNYTDTGSIAIYFGTDREYIDKSISLVYKEFEKLRQVPLGSMQLKKAKRQLMGQLAISSESNENRMLSFGRHYLHFDKITSVDQMHQSIEAITAEQLQEVANDILNPDKMSVLIYK